MGKIFYIMGKSSSGKDSIYRQLEGDQELGLKRLVIYTTRPIRDGEVNGREYFFADENKLKEFRRNGKLIEARTYQTVYGPWTYFTADDGQVSVGNDSYLGIGTLESFVRLREYYGNEVMWPVYIEVEDGERLERALARRPRRCRSTRRCAGVFWQTRMIFPRKIFLKQVYGSVLRIIIWMNV